MKDEFCGLSTLFQLYRHELGYSFVACIVAIVRHWQTGDKWREIASNAVLVALVAFGVQNILDFFGIDSSQWAYLASVWIGYVGVEGLIAGIGERLPVIAKGKGK